MPGRPDFRFSPDVSEINPVPVPGREKNLPRGRQLRKKEAHKTLSREERGSQNPASGDQDRDQDRNQACDQYRSPAPRRREEEKAKNPLSPAPLFFRALRAYPSSRSHFLSFPLLPRPLGNSSTAPGSPAPPGGSLSPLRFSVPEQKTEDAPLFLDFFPQNPAPGFYGKASKPAPKNGTCSNPLFTVSLRSR